MKLNKAIAAFAVVITIFFRTAVAQTQSDQLNAVITQYLELKDALVKDQGDSARIAAKGLYTAIEKLPMEKLSAEQHKAWMQYYQKLSYHAEHIKETDDLAHQREHFVSLSSNMYKLLTAANMNTVTLYYEFCPMANGNKGAYWLSAESEIMNPYFGKKMLNCGSVKDSIKVAQ
ncbi:MAG: DUF3347 domain-containing protein [Bacteroidetes bacterium]|nr:DUF3347 domain-containing protein [Bacteroidota bacterium]